MTQFDPVSKPEHYNKGKIECIDAIESAVAGLSGSDAAWTANVIKYMWRWKQKGGVQDLKKARWYINRLLGEENPGEQFDEGKIKKLEDELAEVKLRRLETVAMCDMLKAENDELKARLEKYETAHRDIRTDFETQMGCLGGADYYDGRANGFKLALVRLDYVKYDPLQSDGT